MGLDRKKIVAGLVEEHGRMVYATAYRIVGNPDDAEDALQEVFLKLLKSWTLWLRPEGVRNWGAYLRVAAIHSAVRLLRRRRRAAGRTVPLDDQIVACEQPDPRRAASDRQRAELLRRALAALPERQARVFVLRFFEDCSYEEIAGQTGLSVGRVGALIHKARRRLRKTMACDLDVQGCCDGTPRPRSDAPEKEASHVAG